MVLTSKIEKQKKEKLPQLQVNDLCRQKLLGYAESFQELAKSYEDKFEESGEDRQSVLEELRVWENRKVICDNLSEVAQIMVKVAREELDYQPMESRYQRILLKALREEGIYADNFRYLSDDNGKQAIGITLWTAKKGVKAASEVADMLSVLLHKPLQVSVVSPYLVDGESKSFVFVEEAKYIALTGFAKLVRENEVISGDNFAFLESEKGKMTMLLSDGTGSGEKASRDSGRVLDLLEKMLEAGYGIRGALNLINSVLYVKGEDSNHPTIDICHVDLQVGTCEFYKVGGTISFLKRGEKVEIIEVGNLPLGIFQNVKAEGISRKLEDGDFLVMMSDGVLDAFREEDYRDTLLQAIAGFTEQNPGELAEKLMHLAICSCEGHICDDMTILVAGVWENNGIT